MSGSKLGAADCVCSSHLQVLRGVLARAGHQQQSYMYKLLLVGSLWPVDGTARQRCVHVAVTAWTKANFDSACEDGVFFPGRQRFRASRCLLFPSVLSSSPVTGLRQQWLGEQVCHQVCLPHTLCGRLSPPGWSV